MCIFEVVFPFSEHGQLLQPAVKLFNEDIAYWGHGPPASEWPPLDSTYRGGVLAFLNGVFHLSAGLNPEAVGGPTDIGLLDSNGAWWIRRKDFDKLSPFERKLPAEE